MNEAYNVTGSIWFGVIGIVRVDDIRGNSRYYIGKGKGLNQKEDEQFIAAWGQTFNPNDSFFGKNEKIIDTPLFF